MEKCHEIGGCDEGERQIQEAETLRKQKVLIRRKHEVGAGSGWGVLNHTHVWQQNKCSTWGRAGEQPITLPRQHRRASPGGKDVDEPAQKIWTQESRLCPSSVLRWHGCWRNVSLATLPHYLRQAEKLAPPLIGYSTLKTRPCNWPGHTVKLILVVGVLVIWFRGHESWRAGPVPGWLWQLGELA